MQTDWIGEWFRVFEGMGENVDILCARLPAGASAPTWHHFSHTRVDGLGALQELFERTGGKPGPLPQYPGHSPAWPVRFWSFVRYMRSRPQLAPSARERLDRKGPPAGVAWAVVSPEASRRAQKNARAAKVNSNIYTLHALNAAVSAAGLATNEVPAWLIPVNLRGAVTLPDPKANHSSFLSVSITPGSTPRHVADGLKAQLVSGMHFGAWMAMNLGVVIGLERYRTRTRGLLDKPFGWTGVFSNLGSWRGAQLGIPAELEGAWLGCPPSSRKVPVSCGCISVDGRLGVGLQLHPSLVEGEAAARELVARFLEHLLPGEKAGDVATLGFSEWASVMNG